MAKVVLIRTSSGPRLLYGVDGAVGPGGPNQKSDVLLVQYFLREIFKGTDQFKQSPFPGVLAVDGIAGQQTFAAILHFQRVMKKQGSTITTDGRVDRIEGEHVRGSISGTQYTIIFLNFGYHKARPADWPRVSKAGDCPGELRPLLSEPVFLD
jgi:hypothetical protein